ncbi:MAG: hypothetical protein K0Q94_5575 [Paenibacillus sp.]|jgi:hypothetical protein|uniref:hypothetical protein n=1 Tax=Paenibacillus sp. GCM10012303 TaxID=3317340 RepID=UPI0029EFF69B|nr:hypothetical protein [Paenibacillus sp.]
MHVILFLSFSSLEWLALVVLMFTMFRFQLRDYAGQLLFTAFLLSLFSYVVFHTLQIKLAFTLLQPPVVFLFLWQIYRIQPFYAGLMTTYGYLAYLLVQKSVLFGLYRLGLSPAEVLYVTWKGTAVQCATAAIAFLAAYLFGKYRLGYTFVPDSVFAPVHWNRLNVTLLVLSLIGYGIVAVSGHDMYESGSMPLLLLFMTGGIMGVLLRLALKKEESSARRAFGMHKMMREHGRTEKKPPA